MARLNDLFRPLFQLGATSTKQRQESLRDTEPEYQEVRDARGEDVHGHRKQFSGAVKKSETVTNIPEIRESSASYIESVESSRSWSTTIPSVYRESVEQDDSWANSSDLSLGAGRKNPLYIPDRRRPEQLRDASSSSSSGEQLETLSSDGRARALARQERSSLSRARQFRYVADTSPVCRAGQRDETSSSEGRSYQHSEGEPEVIEPIIYEHEVWNLDHDAPEVYYYIVPGGLNVIFRDEEGNVSRRVGEFGDTIHKPRRVSPTVIQDEFGNELYRTGDFGHALTPGSMSDEDQEEQLQPHSRSRDRRMHRSRGHSGHDESQHNASPYGAERSVSSKAYSAISYASVPSNAANIILIDDRGQQIPIRTSGGKSPSFGANVRHAGQYSH